MAMKLLYYENFLQISLKTKHFTSFGRQPMELILSHEIARRILFLFLETVLKFYSILRRFYYEALWIVQFRIPHKMQITCF